MNQKLWSIQYLRAFAALAVVLVHTTGRSCTIDCGMSYPQLDLLAKLSVELFFVISGVVMWLTVAGRTVYPNEFLTKRFLRIAPLYYILTLFVAAVALALPWLLRTTKFDAEHLAYSLMFMPYQHPVANTLWPVLIPGWSLNYEMFFYTLFSMSLMLAARKRLLMMIGTLFSLAALGCWFSFDNVYLKFYTNPIILDFAAGMLAAAAFENKLLHGQFAAFAKAALGTAIMITVIRTSEAHPNVAYLFSVGAAFLVWGFIELETFNLMPRVTLLKWLGDISYSLYLLQMITIGAVSVAWQYLALPTSEASQLAFELTAIGFSIASANWCYRYIELPSQSWSVRFSAKVRAFEAGQVA
jgi:exopolysaccharide production protein ExoZ